MSEFVYKALLVYTNPDEVGGEPHDVQATRALVSIANSLAVLADETPEISPIVHAAFISGGASCDEPPPASGVTKRGGN